MIMQLFLPADPIVQLQHKGVRRSNSPDVIEVAAPTRLVNRHPSGSVMLPNEVKGRTGQVFPACYQIGTEFIETEIRILEASGLCTPAYAIHAICIAELLRTEFLESLTIGSGKGICGVLKSIVLRCRCKR